VTGEEDGTQVPRLLLVNPSNPLVNMATTNSTPWIRRYRVWKPLGLLVLAGLTPPEWETTIVDENLAVPDYQRLSRPDLVGITAFTSQANRAYEIAAYFRGLGVPVVMGGIHATMCLKEAEERVDSVVTGEAEGVWADVLEDVMQDSLKRCYEGGLADMTQVPLARHDLLPAAYAFGAVQTTRGCPLNCRFCSVTAFNGARHRQRPIPAVLEELRSVPERRVLLVDDNLIGTRPAEIAHAKDLFRAIAKANLGKQVAAQVSINFADDEELLDLAAKAGCAGVFIGFESSSPEGLMAMGKKSNLFKGRDYRESVRRIQRHDMLVIGSFIIGLDGDEPGIGKDLAQAASEYSLDALNVLFLTPLPGTRLWDDMNAQNRIGLNRFPDDWKYYTLTHPVAKYKHLSHDGIIDEMVSCNRDFYSAANILARMGRALRQGNNPLLSLAINYSCRRSSLQLARAYAGSRPSLTACPTR
jgi:radical SAM superfamily enzyme YgiQ (UPF0313 family)